MILTANNKIACYLGNTINTNSLPIVATYVDHTSLLFNPVSIDTFVSGITSVDIIAAPTGNTTRQIKYISIHNADTNPQTIFVEVNAVGVQKTLLSYNIGVNETLNWNPLGGWQIYSETGAQRKDGIVFRGSRLLTPYGSFSTANATTTKTITSTNTFLQYVGVSSRATTQVTLRYNVTTQAQTITWAELVVFTGLPTAPAGTPSLSMIGWIDASAIINSTGVKSTTITLTTRIKPGDNIWIGVGNEAGTAAVFRACSVIDDSQAGTKVGMVARPSTVANPSNWTIDTAAPLWIYAYLEPLLQ